MGCMLSLHYHTTSNNLGTYRLYFVKFKLKILPTKSTQLRRWKRDAGAIYRLSSAVCAKSTIFFAIFDSTEPVLLGSRP